MYRGVGVSGYRGGPWKIGKFLAQMGAAAGRRGTAEKLGTSKGKRRGEWDGRLARRTVEQKRRARRPSHSFNRCEETSEVWKKKEIRAFPLRASSSGQEANFIPPMNHRCSSRAQLIEPTRGTRMLP